MNVSMSKHKIVNLILRMLMNLFMMKSQAQKIQKKLITRTTRSSLIAKATK